MPQIAPTSWTFIWAISTLIGFTVILDPLITLPTLDSLNLPPSNNINSLPKISW